MLANTRAAARPTAVSLQEKSAAKRGYLESMGKAREEMLDQAGGDNQGSPVACAILC
jgi:hypothetical protein